MDSHWFTPDHQHYFQVGIDSYPHPVPVTNALRCLLFGFSQQDHPLVIHPLTFAEPNHFGTFTQRWMSPLMHGNAIAGWTGFMALRYLLGYFSQWVLLPPAIRYQAWHPTARTVTPPVQVIAAIRAWDAGWEHQLDPLLPRIETLRHPQYAALAG